MNVTVEMLKELPDGSAICTLDLDKEAVQFLIGEGFLTIIKRAIDSSESYVKPKLLDEALKDTIDSALDSLKAACGVAPKYKILDNGAVYFYMDEVDG